MRRLMMVVWCGLGDAIALNRAEYLGGGAFSFFTVYDCDVWVCGVEREAGAVDRPYRKNSLIFTTPELTTRPHMRTHTHKIDSNTLASCHTRPESVCNKSLCTLVPAPTLPLSGY